MIQWIVFSCLSGLAGFGCLNAHARAWRLRAIEEFLTSDEASDLLNEKRTRLVVRLERLSGAFRRWSLHHERLLRRDGDQGPAPVAEATHEAHATATGRQCPLASAENALKKTGQEEEGDADGVDKQSVHVFQART